MNAKELIISKHINVRETMKALDEAAKGILFVVDKDDKLCGTVTDGDIRRWILKSGDMEACITEVMNKIPIYITTKDRMKATDVMYSKAINAVPILNKDKRIIDVKFLNKNIKFNMKKDTLTNTSIVIMAGGLGTRLYPYTKILPKPLIPIGDTPIVERIINKFNEYGVEKFYLTVNYKKNMIKSYFNDISKDYCIEYIEEDKPLGTGGSLSLLKGKIKNTFFVSNCDILIDADYDAILKHHKEMKNKITVIASIKNFQIPYGVFKLNNEGNIDSIQEKPEYTFLINTGMYVIEPEVLDDIPNNEFYNLPDILENYRKKGLQVGVYPISEQSWMDMGQISEMKDMVDKVEQNEKND